MAGSAGGGNGGPGQAAAGPIHVDKLKGLCRAPGFLNKPSRCDNEALNILF